MENEIYNNIINKKENNNFYLFKVISNNNIIQLDKKENNLIFETGSYKKDRYLYKLAIKNKQKKYQGYLCIK